MRRNESDMNKILVKYLFVCVRACVCVYVVCFDLMKLKRSRKKEKTKKEEKHVFIDILLIEVEKFPHCFRRRRNLHLYTCTISFPCFVLFYFTLKFFCFLAAMDWMCARIRESPPSFIYLFIFFK